MPDCCHVVVCADASPGIGLGHVMRSLALADHLAAGGLSVTMCSRGVPPRLAGSTHIVEPAHVADAPAVIELRPDLVVVDGYHFDADFFGTLEHHGIEYVVIDDNGDTAARQPRAVINQNPHATATMYQHLDGAPILLLGVQFAMIRREILEVALLAPTRRPETIFVAFGGSDPRRLSKAVALQLASDGLDIRVALGPAHPERAELAAAMADQPGITVIDPINFATELATASGAVLAAGSILLEAACVSTPALGIVVADNQQPLATAAVAHGIACGVLDADELLPTKLASGLDALRSTPPPRRPAVPIDGARRVASALMTFIDDSVHLRPASFDDAKFVFELRTDTEVRRQSFHDAPTWQQHLEWFRSVIDDPDRRLLIVESESCKVGQVRLDRIVDAEVVSLAISAPARGRGLARRSLTAAKAIATGDLVAHIRPDNLRSLAAFGAARFVTESTSTDKIVVRWIQDPSTDCVDTA